MYALKLSDLVSPFGIVDIVAIFYIHVQRKLSKTYIFP